MDRDKSAVKDQPELSGDVGVFGGMFNPPHVGHLAGAQEVGFKLNLQKILFVPTHQPPHRPSPAISAEHRLAMTRLAVADNPLFSVCELEFERSDVSYTFDTLETLKNRYPTVQLHLIIGTDELNSFDTWHQYEKILELARIVVMTRPGFRPDPPELFSKYSPLLVEIPSLEIASRKIRARARDNQPLRYLLTPPVEKYIKEKELYHE